MDRRTRCHDSCTEVAQTRASRQVRAVRFANMRWAQIPLDQELEEEMLKVLQYSPIALFLISFPISFFYSPNLPIYVLGDLRESVGAWAVTSYLLTISLGALAVTNYKEWLTGRFVSWVLLIITIGLVVLHYLPILLYWDVIQSDGIIRDDTANPVVQANILMFIWHIGITLGSVFVGIMALLHAVVNKHPERTS